MIPKDEVARNVDLYRLPISILMLYLYPTSALTYLSVMKSLETYLSGFHSSYSVFDKTNALSLYKPRDPFAHKGNFGHALIIAGSYGKMGAAVLAAKACLIGRRRIVDNLVSRHVDMKLCRLRFPKPWSGG